MLEVGFLSSHVSKFFSPQDDEQMGTFYAERRRCLRHGAPQPGGERTTLSTLPGRVGRTTGAVWRERPQLNYLN